MFIFSVYKMIIVLLENPFGKMIFLKGYTLSGQLCIGRKMEFGNIFLTFCNCFSHRTVSQKWRQHFDKVVPKPIFLNKILKILYISDFICTRSPNYVRRDFRRLLSAWRKSFIKGKFTAKNIFQSSINVTNWRWYKSQVSPYNLISVLVKLQKMVWFKTYTILSLCW